MVLTRTRSIEAAGNIKQNPFNYMVLDAKRLKYGCQKEKFKCAVEILNFLDLADTINKTIEKLESPQHIKTEIFYEAIERVIEGFAFHEVRFKKYLVEVDKVYSYSRIFENIADTDYYMPFEVDYLLLGLTAKELSSTPKNKMDDFSESYGDIWSEHSENKITADQYIARTKLLIENLRRKS